MQGGIHPHYTGHTYLAMLRSLKAALPALHVHAFSPLAVVHGARTLGLSLAEYLAQPAGHGGGNTRRPGSRAHLPRQAQRRAVG